jgi:hypothetical protein
VSAAWIVKDSKGQMLPDFIGRSWLEVARKVLPTRYDAFRLQVSSSYREMFDRDLKCVLERKAWQIVPVQRPADHLRAQCSGKASAGIQSGLAGSQRSGAG